MMPVTVNLQMLAGKALGNPALYLFGIDQLAGACVWLHCCRDLATARRRGAQRPPSSSVTP
jgi:hypothetical protein